MIMETQLIERLRNRLLALGYPANALRVQVRTDYGMQADLVVYESGKPKVVFEVKAVSAFPKMEYGERLPFNPTVRQAQFLAGELGALYFAIFDGEHILWFDIDDRNGRPRLISDPIGPSTRAASITSSDDPETALRLVYALHDLVIGVWDVHKTLAFVGYTLLLKLRAELSGTSLAGQVSELRFQERPDIIALQSIYDQFDIKDSEYFTRASLILDSVTLSELPFASFARALDEVIFIHRKQVGVFKLPVWLLNLIAVLSQPGNTDSVLDIYSNYGDGVAAIAGVSETVRITTITPNDISYLWDLLKRMRLGLSPRGLVYADLTKNHEFLPELWSQRFDRVLIVPPFGLWLKNSEGRRITQEEFFLSAALDWLRADGRVVALLPENFLSSQRHQQFRDSVLERMRLRAVISLERFMPGTAVLASIVVLEERSFNNGDQRVAMLRILNEERDFLRERQQPIQEHAPIQAVIALLSRELEDGSFPESENFRLIASGKLVSSSWAVTSHLPLKVVESESLFPAVPLGEIATLRKGVKLTLDRNGPLLVIGPASIRQFVIDPTKLDRTTKERLPKRPVVAQSGDVLIHAISNYRGHAAAVDPDFEGFFISRNVIVVRPNPSVILSQYLSIALNGRFVRQQLDQLVAGSTIPQLTIDLVEKVLIPMPEIETQQAIVERVENALKNRLTAEQRLFALIDTFHKGGEVDV